MQQTKPVTAAAALGAVLALLGTMGAQAAPQTAPKTAPKKASSVKPAPTAPTGRLTAIPAHVHPGETVTIRYTVANPTARQVTVPFRSAQMFDIEAAPPAAAGPATGPVWRWSNGRMFATMLSQLVLAPGKSRTFTATWKVAESVPAGAYVLTAHLARPAVSSPSTTPIPSASATARVVVDAKVAAAAARPAPKPDQPQEIPTVPLGVLLTGSAGQPPAAERHPCWVIGIYRGHRGGPGAPPTGPADWVLADDDGHKVYVAGPVPDGAKDGDRITVFAALKRAADGQRVYLDAAL